jgi:DinB superfamily
MAGKPRPIMAKPVGPGQKPEPRMIDAEPIPSIVQSQFSLTSRPSEPEPAPEAEMPAGEIEERAGEGEIVEPEPSASRVEPIETQPPVPDMPVEEAPAPEPPTSEPPAPELPAPEPPPYPQTMREVFARVDSGWLQFLSSASSFPSERMDEHLSEGGWTRKQMLAHISAWHDTAHDRLGEMILSGKPSERSYDADPFNARVARQAIGRTAGEVLKEMEMTFNRLRRQLGRLTDQQLQADDGWAARLIASETYEHYLEHAPDVYLPPPPDPKSGRR